MDGMGKKNIEINGVIRLYSDWANITLGVEIVKSASGNNNSLLLISSDQAPFPPKVFPLSHAA
uniref:AlNc14C373G11140 protein n=1 Tax=Albugo laibachii Nc14 TaxID=890382 RepID=F0WY80_9STRA|nr:AlNc14C373G11140 [Albugo laibachii Nc14]|eukprot:CCA26432.1 AlNc14C373G11140 [Albugo laibachii Nc14]